MKRLLVILLILSTSLGMSIPVLAAYLLKAGDVIEVTVWQDPKLNRRVIVGPDGSIAFPLAGHFKAGGRSVVAVESELRSILQKQYKDQIDVTVSVAEIKELPVPPPPPPAPPPPPPIDPAFFITGEIKKPGKYFFKTTTNVLQAISLAGGLGTFAASRRIVVRRKINGSETLLDFDYDAFTTGVDLSNNFKVHSGDVIIVPEKGLFE
jgi:polysaccharide biosynthesis/export protein